MGRKEKVLDAVSRAGVVRIRTVANSPLWLSAVSIPTSFAAALVALALGERAFALGFAAIAALAFLYAVGFMTYVALVDPDRLQSEEYQIEQKRLTLRSKEHPEPRTIAGEIIAEEAEPPQLTRGEQE